MDIINSMLKFWPVSLTSKQILFLNELEEILELVQPPEFASVQKVLFKRVAQCINCPHFQVLNQIQRMIVHTVDQKMGVFDYQKKK